MAPFFREQAGNSQTLAWMVMCLDLPQNCPCDLTRVHVQGTSDPVDNENNFARVRQRIPFVSEFPKQ